MKRLFVLGAIVLAGGVGAAIVQAQQAAAPQGRGGGGFNFPPVSAAEKVADNLYMIPGQGGNTAAWVMANGVLLVDTKLANNGQAILDEVKKVTDKPITYIINTHTHGDHTGSNQFFPASVQIVTQANTAANMAKMDVFKEAANKHGLPDRTFTDKMSLFKGKEEVELRYFGASHTNGDAFVVFKSVRVMHSGDAFANKGQPLIDRANGGSGIAYPATLKAAAKAIKNVDKVIPGHAPVMTWQDFVDAGQFNQLMLDYAKAALAANKTPEQALMEFTLPESLKAKGFAQPAAGRGGAGGNFTILFEELKGAK
ncbi:MAG TPA: MBL fold metallo-hydrolase [Vicinamibacterales bacterium]|jgi:glyoxylase-like metal-dependent hydrolase (beta-lactamase superfamily II)|nr:MBL fold metallo-hydrolase [Vicinamibacterales bacterium]